MNSAATIDQYAAGPAQLRAVVSEMTPEEINAVPVAGQWSTRQVICHLADFEPVYANRMKRVIAEDAPPTLAGGFHDQFARNLSYDIRNIDEELDLIDVVRAQMTRILRTLPADAFDRTGLHSVDGPLTLQTLLERITNHIPHHLKFIEEKKRALQGT